MLKIENSDVVGWEAAIRGMRNPKNSWNRSDSYFDTKDCAKCFDRDPGYTCDREVCNSGDTCFKVGINDHTLMMTLANGGPVHAKYRRMIVVYADVTAPLYWWKEYDTYKVGTVTNSCSTMHKIHDKEFTIEDFSCEHLNESSISQLNETIKLLNTYRSKFIETNDKTYWWQMIQLLPSSYNQKRTIMLNYEVLAGIYPMRKNHKLDEWHVFCDWIKSLPYSEIITDKIL